MTLHAVTCIPVVALGAYHNGADLEFNALAPTLSAPEFERLYALNHGDVFVPAEVDCNPEWYGEGNEAQHEELLRDLMRAAQTLADLAPGAEGFVFLAGEGTDCDGMWVRVRVSQ